MDFEDDPVALREAHLRALKQEVEAKVALLNLREQERLTHFATWSESERELRAIMIQECREETYELKRQLNSAQIAYNESISTERTRPFGQRHFSKAQMRALQAKLQAPVADEDIKVRVAGGGQEVPFIPTFIATRKAADIFGLENFAIEVKSDPALLFQNNANGRNSICMKAVVRVTLANGCFHEDVGIATSTMNDPVEAIKTAAKSCVSDATKRVMMHFGPALGSCLKDKEFIASFLSRHKQQQQPQQQRTNGSTWNNPAGNSGSNKQMKMTPQQHVLPAPPPPPQHQQQRQQPPPPVPRQPNAYQAPAQRFPPVPIQTIIPATPEHEQQSISTDDTSHSSTAASFLPDKIPPVTPCSNASLSTTTPSSSTDMDADFEAWALMAEAANEKGLAT